MKEDVLSTGKHSPAAEAGRKVQLCWSWHMVRVGSVPSEWESEPAQLGRRVLRFASSLGKKVIEKML